MRESEGIEPRFSFELDSEDSVDSDMSPGGSEELEEVGIEGTSLSRSSCDSVFNSESSTSIFVETQTSCSVVGI